MSYLERVQRGIDYIEANLGSELSLRDVAVQSGIGQWHFQRIFKALTNETLKTYIRSRRLSVALQQLVGTKQRIIEVALTAGFSSQESFTRAFKKAFDMTPNQARVLGDQSRFPGKIEFNEEYLQHIHKSVSLTPEIVTRERILLIGIKTVFYGSESNKNNCASRLPALWDEFLPRMDEIPGGVLGTAYGVIRRSPGDGNLLQYLAAREVAEVVKVPAGMQLLELPASEYAQFTHHGDVRRLDNTVNYIYSSWLLRSGRWHSYEPDIEIYGSEYQAESDESRIHYAIPLK